MAMAAVSVRKSSGSYYMLVQIRKNTSFMKKILSNTRDLKALQKESWLSLASATLGRYIQSETSDMELDG